MLLTINSKNVACLGLTYNITLFDYCQKMKEVNLLLNKVLYFKNNVLYYHIVS